MWAVALESHLEASLMVLRPSGCIWGRDLGATLRGCWGRLGDLVGHLGVLGVVVRVLGGPLCWDWGPPWVSGEV